MRKRTSDQETPNGSGVCWENVSQQDEEEEDEEEEDEEKEDNEEEEDEDNEEEEDEDNAGLSDRSDLPPLVCCVPATPGLDPDGQNMISEIFSDALNMISEIFSIFF